jgi:hypothetical protein
MVVVKVELCSPGSVMVQLAFLLPLPQLQFAVAESL